MTPRTATLLFAAATAAALITGTVAGWTSPLGVVTAAATGTLIALTIICCWFWALDRRDEARWRREAREGQPMPDPEDPGNRDLLDEYRAILAAVHDKDMQALAALTPERRAVQWKLRWELREHFVGIWTAPQRGEHGRHPVDIGGYGGVQAMLDILGELHGNAGQAQERAGDDEGAGFGVDIVVKSYADEDGDRP